MVSKEPIKIPDIPTRSYKKNRKKRVKHPYESISAQAIIDASQEFLNRGNPKNERDWI